MKDGQRFRLIRSAMAIAQRDTRNVAMIVPEGAIVELIDGPFNGARLMDVNYDGKRVMMFTNDMARHTKVVTGRIAGPRFTFALETWPLPLCSQYRRPTPLDSSRRTEGEYPVLRFSPKH